MEAVTGPYVITAIVLGIAGIKKLFDPYPALAVLSQFGLPERSLIIWCVGVLEIAAAVAALAVGGWVAATAIAVLFAGFALITALLIRSGSGLSCGCFGRSDTSPTFLHVIVNLLGSLSGGLAAATGIGPIPDLLSSQPWSGIPFLVLIAVGVYGLYILMTELPQLTKPRWGKAHIFSSVQSFEEVVNSR